MDRFNNLSTINFIIFLSNFLFSLRKLFHKDFFKLHNLVVVVEAEGRLFQVPVHLVKVIKFWHNLICIIFNIIYSIGQGTVKRNKEVEVTVPAGIVTCLVQNILFWIYLCLGVDTGVNLRLNGQGEPGRKGGPSGHLYVEIRVCKFKPFLINLI